ncbi:MAG: YicC family protein [Paramuribaculum sp.]|nr:YicC family protein [Paramuribaculum sp.]
MILSMTGFGKASAENNNKKITVEIKSLNSKQMDFTIRMPSLFREKDNEIRNILTRKLLRGKIELFVYLDNDSQTPASQFNSGIIAAYKSQIEEISANLNIPLPNDWYSLFLRLPDVLKSEIHEELEDVDSAALIEAVEVASDQLTAFRMKEGEKLKDFFSARISEITRLLAEVDSYEAERIPKIRARILDNLAKLSGVEIDQGRLEQEMIYYIEKLDVNEEKQRLRQHLDYFMETINSDPGQGKKLGFIAQEMGREINTLGSKSNHAEMQKIVVKMKDELEQIKEQVLNVL